MTIQVGDKAPSVTLHVMGEDGPDAITTDDLFKGKKVAFFALPGAFTPTCSAQHLPGFVDNAEALDLLRKSCFEGSSCQAALPLPDFCSVSHLQIDDSGDDVELDAVSAALVAVSLAEDTEYLEAANDVLHLHPDA